MPRPLKGALESGGAAELAGEQRPRSPAPSSPEPGSAVRAALRLRPFLVSFAGAAAVGCGRGRVRTMDAFSRSCTTRGGGLEITYGDHFPPLLGSRILRRSDARRTGDRSRVRASRKEGSILPWLEKKGFYFASC